jgi:hypothetical protein
MHQSEHGLCNTMAIYYLGMKLIDSPFDKVILEVICHFLLKNNN